MRSNKGIDSFSEIFHGSRFEIFTRENLITTHINDFALLIHNLVVLQYVLTDFAVALFNSCLGALNCFGDHLGLNCLVVWQCSAHHPTKCSSGKQTQQFIVEAEIETARSGVTLTTCTTTQLIVDTTAVVAFGT